MRYSPDYTGQRWGRLLIIEKVIDGNRTKWHCLCDCGNTTIVPYSSLSRGLTKSCGCIRKEHTKQMGENNRLEPGESLFYYVYDYYVKSAKKRGYSFDLEISYFRILTKQNCFYCGAEPSNAANKKNAYGQYVYNGIDRVDNNRGYTVDNCVPCCKVCNSAKLTMGYTEFINWVIRIYAHIQERKLYEFERIKAKLEGNTDGSNSVPRQAQTTTEQTPGENL